MRKAIIPLVLLLSGTLLISSCKKETTTLSELEQGQNFYPLQIGKYVVYDVDSLVYNDLLRATIPSECQLRYNVVDTFRNNAGELSYVINVLYRKEASDEYVPHDVIYATMSDNKLVVTEQNLNFIKLTFPVENGNSWNGNAMIPLGDQDNAQYDDNNWNYVYNNFDQSYNTGVELFQHTVTVNEIDDQLNNPDVDSTVYAFRNYSQEIYAYNVGMIYRERIYWTFQPKAPNGQGGGSGYRKGFSVVMKAVAHN